MNGLVFCKAFHSISESSIDHCITLSTRWLILGNIHFQDDDVGGTSFLDNWNPGRTTSSMCDQWPVVTWDAHPIIDNSNDELWWYADDPNGGRTEMKRIQGVVGYLFFFSDLAICFVWLVWKTWFGGVDTNMVDTCGDLSSWKGDPVFQQYPTCLPILFCRTLEATWWIRGNSRCWFSLPKIRWCFLKMSQLSEHKNNMFA